ncbi:MAG: glycosyltransferase WbuB, partial [Zetaproteobacteria bacterium]
GRGWQLALNYLSFAFWGVLLAPWYFRRQRFDVIFVFEPSPFTVGIPAVLMRWLKRAPILFWVQDLWPESLAATGAVRSPVILRAVGYMVRWIYRRCDRVLVQSEAFVSPVVAAGARRKSVRYFPNWAESFYRPIRSREALPAGCELPQGFRIMFAGNLGEAQALGTIIDAAKRLRYERKVQWIVIGDGRKRKWMEMQCSDLANVHFLGSFPAEDMPSFFAHADALLVTLKADKTFSLTVPSKLQSYMACARPVLAAINGEGARIVSESGCGFSVPAGDSRALADAVRAMLRLSPKQRSEMGERGRKYYEQHFERDMLIERLEAWMQEASEEGLCAS